MELIKVPKDVIRLILTWCQSEEDLNNAIRAFSGDRSYFLVANRYNSDSIRRVVVYAWQLRNSIMITCTDGKVPIMKKYHDYIKILDGFECGVSMPITTDTDTVKLCIECLDAYMETPEKYTSITDSNEIVHTVYPEVLRDLPPASIMKVTIFANYVNCPIMTGFATQAVADLIKGKNPDAIRTLFEN